MRSKQLLKICLFWETELGIFPHFVPSEFFSLKELLICTVHRRKRIHFRLCRSGMRRRFRREDKKKTFTFDSIRCSSLC